MYGQKQNMHIWLIIRQGFVLGSRIKGAKTCRGCAAARGEIIFSFHQAIEYQTEKLANRVQIFGWIHIQCKLTPKLNCPDEYFQCATLISSLQLTLIMYWTYFPCLPYPAQLPMAICPEPQPLFEKQLPTPKQVKVEFSAPVEEQSQDEETVFFAQLERLLRKKYRRPQKKTWKPEQDQKVVELTSLGWSWDRISEQIPDSSPDSCARRYSKLQSMKRKWPPELDELIKQLAESETLTWIQLSKFVKQKSPNYQSYTPKMMRERYKNYLKPGLLRNPWSIQDDMLLARLVREDQLSWSDIAERLSERSQLEIKNRHHGILEPLTKKAAKKVKNLLKKKKHEPTDSHS